MITRAILGVSLAAVFVFAMTTNPVFAASPHMTITAIGEDGSGNPFVEVSGTAGASQPNDAGDIFAYVLVTDAGAFAIASHDFCDSIEQPACPPGPDLTWHAHGIALKSVTEGNKTYGVCLDFAPGQFTDDGNASLSGNRATLTDTSATVVNGALAVQLTILDSGEACVKKVISQV